jgi:hypothetical protein
MLHQALVELELTDTLSVTPIVTTCQEILITMETTLMVHHLDLEMVMVMVFLMWVMDKEVDRVSIVTPAALADTLTQ